MRFRRSIAWAVFVMIACGVPGNSFHEPDFLHWLRLDKLVHIFLFGTQAWLMLDDIRPNQPLTTAAILFSVICYGVLTEWLQLEVFIGRDSDMRDALANSLGVMVGWATHRWYAQRNSGTDN